jgi:hypothetical protein
MTFSRFFWDWLFFVMLCALVVVIRSFETTKGAKVNEEGKQSGNY